MRKDRKIRNIIIIICVFIGVYFLGNIISSQIKIKHIEEELSEYLAPQFEKIKIAIIDESENHGDELQKAYTLKFDKIEFDSLNGEKGSIILKGLGYVDYIAVDEKGEEVYSHTIRMAFEREDSESDFHINCQYNIHEFSRDMMSKAVSNEFFKYENILSDGKSTRNSSAALWFEGGNAKFDWNGNIIESDMYRMIQEITGTKAVMNVVSEDDLMEFSQGKETQGITIYIKKKAPIGNPLWNIDLADIESIDVLYSKNGPKDYFKEFEVEDREKIEKMFELIDNITVNSISTEDMNILNYDEKEHVRVNLYLKKNELLGFVINKNGIFFDDFIGVKSKEEGDKVLKSIEKILDKE